MPMWSGRFTSKAEANGIYAGPHAYAHPWMPTASVNHLFCFISVWWLNDLLISPYVLICSLFVSLSLSLSVYLFWSSDVVLLCRAGPGIGAAEGRITRPESNCKPWAAESVTKAELLRELKWFLNNPIRPVCAATYMATCHSILMNAWWFMLFLLCVRRCELAFVYVASLVAHFCLCSLANHWCSQRLRVCSS